MAKKKKFFEKKANKNALFIALFVALIIFVVETILWAVEFVTNSLLEFWGYDSTMFARGLGLIVAVILLLYFFIDSSKGINE
jgi:hypothetical protein